eukprot:CAMPEP_0185259798 /NCGR_PEP_ID=MMETSP1359-20130426/8506_1 /TAXON_ID=552665 /ORGANISM="Bigelowiella longifila, Strain CCMP242" /LENGTH=248 /DNA_ID=CAMNT_0027845833 /DNA_START=25 /DNA_END=771 /DNA_ORIENTATION=+
MMSQQQREGGNMTKPLSASSHSPFSSLPASQSTSARCSTRRWRGRAGAGPAPASSLLSSSRYRGNSWDVIYGWTVCSSHQLTALQHAFHLATRCLESFFGYTGDTQEGRKGPRKPSRSQRTTRMKQRRGGLQDSNGDNRDDRKGGKVEVSEEAKRVKSMINALGGPTASLVSLYKLTVLEERKIKQRVKESYHRLKPKDMQAMLRNVTEGWRRKIFPHLFAHDVERVLLSRGIRDPLAWKEEEGSIRS